MTLTMRHRRPMSDDSHPARRSAADEDRASATFRGNEKIARSGAGGEKRLSRQAQHMIRSRMRVARSTAIGKVCPAASREARWYEAPAFDSDVLARREPGSDE